MQKGTTSKSGKRAVPLLDRFQREMNQKQAQERMMENLRKAREADDDDQKSVASNESHTSIPSSNSLAPLNVHLNAKRKAGDESGKKKKGKKRMISQAFLDGMEFSDIEKQDESVALSDDEAVLVKRVGGHVGHIFTSEGESVAASSATFDVPTQLNTQPGDKLDVFDGDDNDSHSESSSSDGSFGEDNEGFVDEDEENQDDDPFRFTMQSINADMYASAGDTSMHSEVADESQVEVAGYEETEEEKKQKALEKMWSYEQPLDWTVKEDREPLPEELVGMYRTLVLNGGKQSQNTYVKNLWTMLSCYVMDGICTSGKTLKEFAQYYACEKSFNELLKTFPKTEYAKRMLFSHYEDGKWPACFKEFCMELSKEKEMEAAKKWAKGKPAAKELDEEDQMKLYIGYKIKEAWKDAKRDIQKYLAPKWVKPHELRSGWTEEGFYRMLRRSLFGGVCWERAKASESTTNSRNGKNVMTTEERAQKGLDKMLATYDWYPNYWMAFVMYGPPAKDKMLLSLNGGSPEIAAIDPTQDPSRVSTATASSSRSPNSQLAKAGRQSKAAAGRQAQRDGDKVAAVVRRNSDLETAVSTVTTAAPESVEVKHVHVHEVKGSRLQDLRTAIELQSELVKKLKDKAAVDAAFQEEAEQEDLVLLQMYRSVKNLN